MTPSQVIWDAITFASICSTGFFFCAYKGAKAHAEYNREGWNRTCAFQEKTERSKLMFKESYEDALSRARTAEKLAHDYLSRLEKYGLDSEPWEDDNERDAGSGE